MMGEHFKALVTAKDDAWQWVNEGDEVKQKWGYVSTKPMSSLDFSLRTKVVGGEMLAEDHVWRCSLPHHGTCPSACSPL